jgi:hypothetical protein
MSNPRSLTSSSDQVHAPQCARNLAWASDLVQTAADSPIGDPGDGWDDEDEEENEEEEDDEDDEEESEEPEWYVGQSLDCLGRCP